RQSSTSYWASRWPVVQDMMTFPESWQFGRRAACPTCTGGSPVHAISEQFADRPPGADNQRPAFLIGDLGARVDAETMIDGGRDVGGAHGGGRRIRGA